LGVDAVGETGQPTAAGGIGTADTVVAHLDGEQLSGDRLDHIGMFGHSAGGATAAAAMHVDARISAGINMDGALLTPAATAGSDRPFLLIGRQDHHRANDPTWAAFWTNQRGAKLQLNLTGSTHATFRSAVVSPSARRPWSRSACRAQFTRLRRETPRSAAT
jgi:dienelactone hydrolase